MADLPPFLGPRESAWQGEAADAARATLQKAVAIAMENYLVAWLVAKATEEAERLRAAAEGLGA